MSDELLAAAARGDEARVAEVLAASPGLVAGRDHSGATALHAAVRGCHTGTARLLLEHGADPDARTVEGRTPLQDAIEDGCRPCEELLIRSGALVDVCAAAILGDLERLRSWLDSDPALVNDRTTGISPLAWASFGNRVDTARELLARGAVPDDGELLCAASVGHVEVGRLLLESGADPNELHEPSGGTALHAACSMRYTDDARRFVAMLLEHGADPGMRTVPGGLGPEDIARRGMAGLEAGASRRAGFQGILELLRTHGA